MFTTARCCPSITKIMSSVFTSVRLSVDMVLDACEEEGEMVLVLSLLVSCDFDSKVVEDIVWKYLNRVGVLYGDDASGALLRGVLFFRLLEPVEPDGVAKDSSSSSLGGV